ncbi:MAG: hypothetical protein ABIH71_03130 [Candidatus Omnitrophota bacterium]
MLYEITDKDGWVRFNLTISDVQELLGADSKGGYIWKDVDEWHLSSGELYQQDWVEYVRFGLPGKEVTERVALSTQYVPVMGTEFIESAETEFEYRNAKTGFTKELTYRSANNVFYGNIPVLNEQGLVESQVETLAAYEEHLTPYYKHTTEYRDDFGGLVQSAYKYTRGLAITHNVLFPQSGIVIESEVKDLGGKILRFSYTQAKSVEGLPVFDNGRRTMNEGNCEGEVWEALYDWYGAVHTITNAMSQTSYTFTRAVDILTNKPRYYQKDERLIRGMGAYVGLREKGTRAKFNLSAGTIEWSVDKYLGGTTYYLHSLTDITDLETGKKKESIIKEYSHTFLSYASLEDEICNSPNKSQEYRYDNQSGKYSLLKFTLTKENIFASAQYRQFKRVDNYTGKVDIEFNVRFYEESPFHIKDEIRYIVINEQEWGRKKKAIVYDAIGTATKGEIVQEDKAVYIPNSQIWQRNSVVWFDKSKNLSPYSENATLDVYGDLIESVIGKGTLDEERIKPIYSENAGIEVGREVYCDNQLGRKYSAYKWEKGELTCRVDSLAKCETFFQCLDVAGRQKSEYRGQGFSLAIEYEGGTNRRKAEFISLSQKRNEEIITKQAASRSYGKLEYSSKNSNYLIPVSFNSAWDENYTDYINPEDRFGRNILTVFPNGDKKEVYGWLAGTNFAKLSALRNKDGKIIRKFKSKPICKDELFNSTQNSKNGQDLYEAFQLSAMAEITELVPQALIKGAASDKFEKSWVEIIKFIPVAKFAAGALDAARFDIDKPYLKDGQDTYEVVDKQIGKKIFESFRNGHEDISHIRTWLRNNGFAVTADALGNNEVFDVYALAADEKTRVKKNTLIYKKNKNIELIKIDNSFDLNKLSVVLYDRETRLHTASVDVDYTDKILGDVLCMVVVMDNFEEMKIDGLGDRYFKKLFVFDAGSKRGFSEHRSKHSGGLYLIEDGWYQKEHNNAFVAEIVSNLKNENYDIAISNLQCGYENISKMVFEYKEFNPYSSVYLRMMGIPFISKSYLYQNSKYLDDCVSMSQLGRSFIGGQGIRIELIREDRFDETNCIIKSIQGKDAGIPVKYSIEVRDGAGREIEAHFGYNPEGDNLKEKFNNFIPEMKFYKFYLFGDQISGGFNFGKYKIASKSIVTVIDKGQEYLFSFANSVKLFENGSISYSTQKGLQYKDGVIREKVDVEEKAYNYNDPPQCFIGQHINKYNNFLKQVTLNTARVLRIDWLLIKIGILSPPLIIPQRKLSPLKILSRDSILKYDRLENLSVIGDLKFTDLMVSFKEIKNNRGQLIITMNDYESVDKNTGFVKSDALPDSVTFMSEPKGQMLLFHLGVSDKSYTYEYKKEYDDDYGIPNKNKYLQDVNWKYKWFLRGDKVDAWEKSNTIAKSWLRGIDGNNGHTKIIHNVKDSRRERKLQKQLHFTPWGVLDTIVCDNSKVQVMKGLLGLGNAVKGGETIKQDKFEIPQYAVDSQGRKTIDWVDVKSYVTEEEKIKSTQIVIKPNKLGPNIKHPYKLELVNSAFSDETRIGVFRNWIITILNNIAFIYLLILLFFSGIIAGRGLLWRRWRKAKKSLKGKFKNPEIKMPVVLGENEIAAPSYNDYSFPKDYIEVAKRNFDTVIERLKIIDADKRAINGLAAAKENKLREILDEAFEAYQDWRKYVLSANDKFIPTIEDLWLYYVLLAGPAGYFHNDTPSFLCYLFYQIREKGVGDNWKFVRAEYERWYKIIFVAMTNFRGLLKGATANIVPLHYIFTVEDMEGMFSTNKFVQYYINLDNKEERYKKLIEQLEEKVEGVKEIITRLNLKYGNIQKLKIRRRLVKQKKYEDYLKFIRTEWNKKIKDKPLFYKSYPDIVGKVLGGLHILRNMYLPVAYVVQVTVIGFIVGILKSYQSGIVSFSGISITVCLTIFVVGEILLIIFFPKILDMVLNGFYHKKISNHEFDEPVRPDAGKKEIPVNRKIKLFRQSYWGLLTILKVIWNAVVVYFSLIAHLELWGAVWKIEFLGRLCPPGLNIILIAGLWLVFVFFFFFDTFSIFYMQEALTCYFVYSNAGYGVVKDGGYWDSICRILLGRNKKLRILGFKPIEKEKEFFINLMKDKFIPKEVVTKWYREGDSEDEIERKSRVVVARIINYVLAELFEGHMITEDEYTGDKWKIYGENEDDYLAGKVDDVLNLSFFSDIENDKARERIAKFLNSLLMPDMPDMPVWEKIRIMTLMTPLGPGETLLYTYSGGKDPNNSLDTKLNSGITNLTLLIDRYPDEWRNFIAYVIREGIVTDSKTITNMQNLKLGDSLDELKNPQLEWEIRVWASCRFQPFLRTLRGLVYYAGILNIQVRINHPDWNEEKVAKEVIKKYQLLVGHQGYGDYVEGDKPEATETKQLAKYFYEKYGFKFDIAYIQKRKNIPDNWKQDEHIKDKGELFYSVFAEYDANAGEYGEFKDVSVLPLTEDPGIMGEGKPGNQAHTIKFVRGETMMTIDMNQDFYVEQTLKIPHLLTLYDDKDVAIAGYLEDIYTNTFSTIGLFHAIADRTFVLLQKVLNMLGARFHYGHPDTWRTIFAKIFGGVSNSFPVNEDIFGGIKMKLKGKKILYVLWLEAGKARECAMGGVYGISTKFAMGGVQQAYNRWYYYLYTSKIFSFWEKLSHGFGGIGFYLRKFWVIVGNYTYLVFLLVLGVSGFSAFPAEILFASFGIFILAQAITSTGFIGYFIERPMLKAMVTFFLCWLIMSPFFMTHVFSYALGALLSVQGVAFYVGTGRGFMQDHLDMKTILEVYAKIVCLGFIGVVLSVWGIAVWYNPTLILSFPIIALMFFAMIMPFYTNKGTFPMFGAGWGDCFKNWKKDFKDGVKIIFSGKKLEAKDFIEKCVGPVMQYLKDKEYIDKKGEVQPKVLAAEGELGKELYDILNGNYERCVTSEIISQYVFQQVIKAGYLNKKGELLKKFIKLGELLRLDLGPAWVESVDIKRKLEINKELAYLNKLENSLGKGEKNQLDMVSKKKRFLKSEISFIKDDEVYNTLKGAKGMWYLDKKQGIVYLIAFLCWFLFVPLVAFAIGPAVIFWAVKAFSIKSLLPAIGMFGGIAVLYAILWLFWKTSYKS